MEVTASAEFPWVTGQTTSDPRCDHSQLHCSLSDFMGGINSWRGSIPHVPCSELVNHCLIDWLSSTRCQTNVTRQTQRQEKQRERFSQIQRGALRGRDQMCKDEWSYVGRRHHCRKKSGCLGSDIEVLKFSWVDSTVLYSVLTQILGYVQKWGIVFV